MSNYTRVNILTDTKPSSSQSSIDSASKTKMQDIVDVSKQITDLSVDTIDLEKSSLREIFAYNYEKAGIIEARPNVQAASLLQETIEKSKSSSYILANTDNYQIDFYLDQIFSLDGNLQHDFDVFRIKTVRDQIRDFSFDQEYDPAEVDQDLLCKFKETEFYNPSNYCLFLSFHCFLVNLLEENGINYEFASFRITFKIFTICTQDPPMEKFSEIYVKVTELDGLLKAIDGQEKNLNINFANIFRLIIWYKELKANQNPIIYLKLKRYIEKIFKFRPKNICNIFWLLNDNKKNHLLKILKTQLDNKSLNIPSAWNLIDQEVENIKDEILRNGLLGDLITRLKKLAMRSRLTSDVDQLFSELYATNYSPTLTEESTNTIDLSAAYEEDVRMILDRILDLCGMGKLITHYENALLVLIEAFRFTMEDDKVVVLSETQAYDRIKDRFQECVSKILPVNIQDGKFDIMECEAFASKSLQVATSYLLNFVKSHALTDENLNRSDISIEGFWNSNVLIHCLLYVIYRDHLMEGVYHKKELEAGRKSLIHKLTLCNEFIDFGENTSGTQIIGSKLRVLNSVVPFLVEVPVPKSRLSNHRKVLCKSVEPDKVLDMLRLRITVPFEVKNNKAILQEFCTSITAYFMNHLGDSQFGEPRWTFEGSGFKEFSSGFENWKFILRYQFFCDTRTEFSREIRDLDPEIRTMILDKLDTIAPLSSLNIPLEFQVVVAAKDYSSNDDHDIYEFKQQSAIIKNNLPLPIEGFKDSVDYLTYNSLNNLARIPGVDDFADNQLIYKKEVVFMLSFLIEKLKSEDMDRLLESHIYVNQLKVILERIESEGLIPASQVDRIFYILEILNSRSLA